jgi:hypothetical protein
MSSPESVIALIQTHLERYPRAEAMDVYRLLHQATFGPGKAITNVKIAREWLDRENEQVIPNAAETLIESVHPEGVIVRVNLRPYVAQHGNLKALLDAYITSSKAVEGQTATMAGWWAIFESLTQPGGLLASRFEHRHVLLIGRTRTNLQWPAEPHSPVYETLYKPMYRVLAQVQAAQLLNGEHIPFRVI